MGRTPIRLIGLGSLVAFSWAAADPASTVAAPTQAQIDRGRMIFDRNCASCHGKELQGAEFAPPLKGKLFGEHWSGRSVTELLEYIRRNMPPGGTQDINPAEYLPLVALLLNANGARVGERDLPENPDALALLRLRDDIGMPDSAAPTSGSVMAPVKLPPEMSRANPLAVYTPITADVLNAPSDRDWLTWRRTHAAWGFSPLRQVNRRNVGRLQLAWSLALPSGTNETESLVHDGVLFVFSFGDQVQALDAETGDELWHYKRDLPPRTEPTPKRVMALYGDRLFIGTSDVHEIAIDVRSGRVVWDRALADSGRGYSLTGGPLVARGKVMQGVIAPHEDHGGSGYIVALDADSGREIWRFATIARPGAPGGDSWNGEQFDRRQGASVWTSGTYDAQSNTAFFGPGNTYDTAPLRHPVATPGVTNDALYTNSTIALDPDSGTLRWHFQHMRNDQWDLDWAFERQIIQLPVGGRDRKLVITTGKVGIIDALDAQSGEYAFSFDMGFQTLIASIDAHSGLKVARQALLPTRAHAVTVCPHIAGGRNWMPTSYHPIQRTLYVAFAETCMDVVPAPVGEHGYLSTGVNFVVRTSADSDGRFGRLQAINLERRKSVWMNRRRAVYSGGVLTTAGNLLFTATADRWFLAYDARNGKQLWRARLSDLPDTPPITYSVGGRQYVVVVTGHGGSTSAILSALTPESPLPRVASASIWAFSLPDTAAARAPAARHLTGDALSERVHP
jgi:alcohol dehydrogenase (cytochrome c)